jgi:hypothetical protein
MSVAQGVQHARHSVVGLPVVMHDRADDVRQQAAASGAGAVEGEPGGRRDMQPLGLAADAKAGLVHVLDGCGGDAVAHRSDEILQAGSAAATDPRDGRSGDPDAEQIGHQFDQAIFRQQLIVQQIGHDGGNPRAILHGRVDTEGKPGAAVRAAGGAAAVMGAMLGDDERRRLRQVEHLARAVAGAHGERYRRAASRAEGRNMIDGVVGRGDLLQTLVPLLAA